MPVLGINPKVLKEFSESYDLNETKLDIIYSACSTVIHNQPPLPFFSLLEVKFFKHFLEKYLRSLLIVSEKLINEKIEIKKIHVSPLLKEKISLKEALQITHLLEIKYDAELKNIIKDALIYLQKKAKDLNEIWIEPLTLISIFHLLSPSFTRLKTFFLYRRRFRRSYE
ncbi:MAG: hypothetical protein QXO40_04620 [Candidatus Aenigmatarchaeota archaeon]